MAGRRRDRSEALTATGEFLERSFAEDPRVGTVVEVASALAAHMDLDSLLKLTMERLVSLLDAERSSLFLLAEDGCLWSRVALGEEERVIRLRPGEGIAGWVAETGRPLIVKDAYEDPRFNPEWDQKLGFRTRSMICLPMVDSHGTTIGVAQVLNKRQGYFTLDDAMMMRAIMAIAAISIVNVQLYGELLAGNIQLRDAHQVLEARVREIDLLYAIERDLNEAVNLDALIGRMLARAREAVPSAIAEITLPVGTGLAIHRLRAGVAGAQVSTAEHKRGPAGEVLRTGEGLVLAELERSHRGSLCLDSGLEPPPRNGVILPLRSDQEVIGTFALYDRHRPDGGFLAEDTKIMTLIAGQVARAVARQQASERAAREDRLATLGRALASVLHDLRSPMTVASAYAQMMRDADDRTRRGEQAEVIIRQLDRVTEMTRELLAFARGEADLLVRRVLLNAFAAEAAEVLAQIFAGSSVQVRIDARYRGEARFDPHKVARALANLGRNALEALAEVPVSGAVGKAPEVCLTIDRAGDELILRFADTGQGVPQAFRHRMFEAFETHGKAGGTGLGLTMVRQVAESHGGSVSYRDTEGGGATFEIRLPVAGPPAVDKS